MTDRTIRQAVIDELAFDPSIDAVHIAVAVDAGIVTLTGHVASYAERAAAERAAGRVRGVRGVLEQVKVRPSVRPPRDVDLARQIAQILAWNVRLPAGAVRAKAREGWITLTGTVPWRYQKAEAQGAVDRVPGVRGLINLIEVMPDADASDLRGDAVRGDIEAALRRNAQLDAGAIAVDVHDGGRVILTGKVRALGERVAAEGAAWSAPGIRAVENLIETA